MGLPRHLGYGMPYYGIIQLPDGSVGSGSCNVGEPATSLLSDSLC
jgi:hypothetical protein